MMTKLWRICLACSLLEIILSDPDCVNYSILTTDGIDRSTANPLKISKIERKDIHEIAVDFKDFIEMDLKPGSHICLPLHIEGSNGSWVKLKLNVEISPSSSGKYGKLNLSLRFRRHIERLPLLHLKKTVDD